jgi:hypothetical protein
LQELDGVELAKSSAGDRLKKFFSREELDEDWEERQNRIRDDVGRDEEGMNDEVVNVVDETVEDERDDGN